MIAAVSEVSGALPWGQLWVLSLGLLGSSLLDRFREEEEADGDDSLLGDDGGGGGGLDGLGDDGGGGGGGLGGLDDGGGDDGLGDLGDMSGMGESDDPFGEDDGDNQVTELANRVDELEGEVANLSSTVNTVRSENEEISEQVDDIAEDVRNLLDIYEMVTRGINPFVDEGAGMGGEAADASFGLFDDDGDQQEEADDLDEDIAEADAEGFFDEELAEEDPIEEPDDGAFADDESEDDEDGADDAFGDDEFGDGEFGEMDDEFGEMDDEFGDGEFGEMDDEFGDDAGDDEPSEADSDEDDAFESDDQEDTMASDSGKSFSELKDEYESGEADWADEGESAEEPSGNDEGLAPPEDDGLSMESADSPEMGSGEPSMGGTDAMGGADEMGGPMGDEPMAGGQPSQPEGTPAPAESETANQAEGGFQFVGSDELSQRQEKPYLTELPGDYVGDLLVMEWLEYLVEEGDTTDAVRAINYYERVEWLSPEVAEQLKSFLSGFGEIDRNLIDEPGTARLELGHHTRSLKYIMQLSSATAEAVVLDRWPQLSEGSYGAQR